VGRGGWTWYTGAAGWMQRAGLEHLLGVRIRDGFLEIDPCIPDQWPGFAVTLQHLGCRYDISVTNPHGVCRGIAAAEVDGVPCPQNPAGAPLRIPLQRGAVSCAIRIILGSRQSQ